MPAGDFNCYQDEWGFNHNRADGECLAGWARISSLALLFNAKDAARFYSGLWNADTYPDLAFARFGPNNCLPNRRALKSFPGSQHRPSFITPPSMLVKRWNFHKAKWSHYIV